MLQRKPSSTGSLTKAGQKNQACMRNLLSDATSPSSPSVLPPLFCSVCLGWIPHNLQSWHEWSFFSHLSFSSLGLSEGRSGRHTDGSNGRKDDSEGDVLSPNAPLIIQRNPKATVQKKKVKVSPGFSAAVTGEEGGSKRSVRHWRQKNHGVMTITSYSHDLWAQQSKVWGFT